MSLVPDPDRPNTYLIGRATEPAFGAQMGPSILTNVHNVAQCTGRHCVIHNPSDHHMREWEMNWRDDTGVMERICPHGVGHPDPDSAEFMRRVGAGWANSHGCDGCCSPPP